MGEVKRLKTLGLDLGTNSLGWCLVETKGEPGVQDEGQILGIGCRIFPDGRTAKSKESLAVERRKARGARKRRDRYVRRRRDLLQALTEYGLMPASKQERKELLRATGDGKGADLSQDVYALRARALEERLEPYHLGRALFHLDQRRGFKSNRKTDRGNNEAGKIETGVARLEQAMGAVGARSYGEFLHKRRLAGKSVRTRLRPETGEGAKGTGYDFYPSRAMLEGEFDKICAAQARHHPEILTDKAVARLRNIIFYQRSLKPVKPGLCSYHADERREPKAHPLFQDFRLYKEVNELAIIGPDQKLRKLTPDERNALIHKLRACKSATFPGLRKVLKLGPEFRFNKETENRKGLTGNEVFAALSNKDCFGPAWAGFDQAQQWRIITKLREEEDPEKLLEWQQETHSLDKERAEAVMKVQLPEGYGRLGETALENLLDALKHEVDEAGKVITEAEAAKRCGYNHSDRSDPDFPGYAFLPKYQEMLYQHIIPGEGSFTEPPDEKNPSYDRHMGRITNPTVHIALNQLRRAVNAIIKRYGRPDRIAIELGRELKLSDTKKREVNTLIKENTDAAQERSKKLTECFKEKDTGYNRLRLKLWEELNLESPENRVCIYSGEPITPSMIFTAEVDVDHILPRSRTLDDSQANLILCKAHANRQKRNRAPADVAEWQGHYEAILARAANLPLNKRWRFASGAMEQFEEKGGFLARQLTDMQYASRLAKSYLEALYPGEVVDQYGEVRKSAPVRALPGRMTEMLRRNWGLNSLLPDHNYAQTAKQKNRKDHRHHAIDAAVIACTSRALLQKIATASGKEEKKGDTEQAAANTPPPWTDFREDLQQAVKDIIVSHKPDHGTVSRARYETGQGQTAGKLHNETAYGLTGEENEKGIPYVAHRKPLEYFKSEKDLMKIRDSHLRDQLWEATRGLSGKEFQQALIAFCQKPGPFQGLRRIRIQEALQTIPIRDKNGNPYKGYMGDSNYRYDVWQLPNGEWEGEVVTTFQAHMPDFTSSVRSKYHNPKKILSLMIDDMVAYQHPETSERVIARVRKFDVNKVIYFDAHHEAGSLDKRHKDPNDPFRSFSKTPGALKDIKIRQVRVDELGQVFDPGPRG